MRWRLLAPRWLGRQPHGREALASTGDFLRTSCPAICPTTGLTNPTSDKNAKSVAESKPIARHFAWVQNGSHKADGLPQQDAKLIQNLWFSDVFGVATLTHSFLSLSQPFSKVAPWHEDFESSAVARDHHLDAVTVKGLTKETSDLSHELASRTSSTLAHAEIPEIC